MEDGWRKMIMRSLGVRKIVRSHIFSKVKLCKGEGKRTVNNFDKKKTAKIIKFGVSHKKADLRKNRDMLMR